MRIDLNLANIFLAIWRHRSVSRAAGALNLSQSAVSGSLARLREQLDDPLFVRTRSAMEPTPRAVEIAPMLESAVAQMQRAMAPAGRFDPRIMDRAITIGMSDDYMLACGPALLRRIAAEAPRASIIFRQCNSHTAEGMLETGEIEIAMVSTPRLRSRTMRYEAIGTSDYLCLADAAALGTSFPLSLDAYVDLPHILVSYSGRSGIVDQVLRNMGRERRIMAALTQFAALPPFLTGTKAICTLPSHAAIALVETSGLRTCAPPVPIERYDVSLVWRSDKQADATNQWLRESMADAWNGCLHCGSRSVS